MKRPMMAALIMLALCTTSSLSAQEIIRQKQCATEAYQPQIDSLKQLLASQGFALMREASMTMESEYEMPVIMPLSQGNWYHFVFIGDPTSKLYEVRMYDWTQKEVVYKKLKWGDVSGNIIDYTYVPEASQYHIMKPVQVNKEKKKGLCGYVM